MWPWSASVTIGSSPKINKPLISFLMAAPKTSVACVPGFGFSFLPQAFSNFFNTSGFVTFWYPGKSPGKAPISHAP